MQTTEKQTGNIKENSSLKCRLKQLAKQGSCANSVILGPQLCLVSNQCQTKLLYSISSPNRAEDPYTVQAFSSTASDPAHTQPRELSWPGKGELGGHLSPDHSGRRKLCRTVFLLGGVYFHGGSHHTECTSVFLKHVFCHNISTCCNNTLNISFDAKFEVLHCFWTSRPAQQSTAATRLCSSST